MEFTRNDYIRWTATLTFFLFGIINFNFIWLRGFHIIFGFAWWSLLFFLAIIVSPVLGNMSEETQENFVGHIVPRVFVTVSSVAFLALGFGWKLLIEYYIEGDWGYLHQDSENIIFSIAITLTTLLYGFHLFLEQHEIKTAKGVRAGLINSEDEKFKQLLRGLKIIPRAGFLLVTINVLIMFYHI